MTTIVHHTNDNPSIGRSTPLTRCATTAAAATVSASRRGRTRAVCSVATATAGVAAGDTAARAHIIAAGTIGARSSHGTMAQHTTPITTSAAKRCGGGRRIGQ